MALPTEILSHIFVQCAQLSGTVHLPFRRRQIPIQIIVSHVCSAWRQIALETPEIWTDVSIENLFEEEPIYNAWLSRAGHRPIRLALNLVHLAKRTIRTETTDTQSTDTTTDTFWKVVKHRHVKYLKLKIYTNQLSRLVESPGNTLHDLEQLDLDLSFDSFLYADVDASAMPRFISRARSVSLDQRKVSSIHRVRYLIQGLALPWAQLSCLQLLRDYVSLSDCILLLLRAPFLEECHFYVGSVNVIQVEQLALPRIRAFSLYLLSEDEAPIDEVIRHFAFPNLAQLSLIGIANWSTETYEIIEQQYNLRSIEHLHLPTSSSAGFTISSSTILKGAPKLRSLDAGCIGTIDDDTLEGISSGDLGYFLKVLTISCFESDIEAVLDMVERRQKTVAQRIERGYSWREDEMASLKEVTMKLLWDGMSTRGRNAVERCRGRYKEKLVELKHLGIHAEIIGWR